MAARLERGFGLLAYGLVALALVGTLAGVGYSIRKAGADAVRAELQPKLEACAAEVEKHNQAARAMAAESAKRQAAASRALAKATVAAKTWEDNAARLRAVLTAPRKAREAAPESCAEAWATIRGQK